MKFETVGAAEDAIKAMNSQWFCNRRIRVESARRELWTIEGLEKSEDDELRQRCECIS